MASPKFIDKNEKLEKAIDFDFLKQTGLDYVQELAGDNWTDYNAHDPGVTILEQLVFALTDLGYRTSLKFEDLLASQKSNTVKDTSFTTAQILPGNPLTTKDFRKIIIDRVKGVSNIWILPLNSFTRRKNIKGLYLALVEVKEEHKKEAQLVCQEVKKKLNKFSNLGEAFEDVILLEDQEIYIDCNIELDANALPEKVHAEILFEIQRLITRPLKFYTLKEMLDRGIDTNEIFDGPRLKNGFIRDEFLLEKDSVFYSSQFLNTIRSIKGVKSINHFNILLESSDNNFVDYYDELNDQVIEDVVVVDWSKKAILGSKIFKDANDQRFFSYTKEGTSINLFQKEVDRTLKTLAEKEKVKFRGKQDHKADIEIPKGNSFNIGEYRTIQESFPNTYALSKNGIPEKSSALRKAQAFQLKAYLLLFEQIISDHLEQLSRFNSLYQLDKDLGSTFFTQIPSDIPDLFRIVGNLRETSNPKKDQQEFEAAVLKIKSELDDFSNRRRQFLSHLFARFGDDSFALTAEKFNYYLSEKENRKQTESNWIDILDNYVHLSGDRARSFDHTSPFWSEDLTEDETEASNLSALEKRVRLTLGIPLKVKRIASSIYGEVNFDKNFPKNITEIESEYPSFSLEYSNNNTISISEGYSYENTEASSDSLNGIEIDEDLFRRGIWEDNLLIHENRSGKKSSFSLLFRIKQQDIKSGVISKLGIQLKGMAIEASESNIEIALKAGNEIKYIFQFAQDANKSYSLHNCSIYRVISTTIDLESAMATAKSLRTHLVQLNTQSEGFYLLDHILLRPREKETRVNVLLNDPTSDWSVRLYRPHDFKTIENGVTKDIKDLRIIDYSIEQTFGKKFIIVWRDEGKLLARCNQKFESKEGAEKKAQEIEQYFSNFSDFDIYNPEKLKFKREIEKHAHPLHHYSFTISVFLSGWTARFRDPEMRNLIQILFRKFTPAHIGINFQWLELDDMVIFESLYSEWLSENRKDNIDFDLLNDKSDQLLSFAKKHVN